MDHQRPEKKFHEKRDIEAEIEGIEREISRLFSRLESLREEKRVMNSRNLEKTSKLSSKKNDQGTILDSTGVTPSETKKRPKNKPEIIPATAQNRRISCFWRLDEIDELKMSRGRRREKCLSLSPKCRRTTCSKMGTEKQAESSTFGSKRPTMKSGRFLSSIQPTTLFVGGDKAVANAKSKTKQGRSVASRYNQVCSNRTNSDLSEAPKCNYRLSCGGGSSYMRGNNQVKKRLEIHPETMIHEDDDGIEEASAFPCELSAIKTHRSENVTPRDSGAAKRVADLVGRKSYFEREEENEEYSIQAFAFDEDDFEE